PPGRTTTGTARRSARSSRGRRRARRCSRPGSGSCQRLVSAWRQPPESVYGRTDQHGTEKSSVKPHRGTVDHHAKRLLRTEGNFRRDGAVLTRANERRRDRGPSTAGRARPNERISGEPAGGRRRRPGWTRALNALTITYPGRRPEVA